MGCSKCGILILVIAYSQKKLMREKSGPWIPVGGITVSLYLGLMMAHLCCGAMRPMQKPTSFGNSVKRTFNNSKCVCIDLDIQPQPAFTNLLTPHTIVYMVQVLENALLGKQYIEAAKLAIRLQKPAKLLQIIRETITSRSESSSDALDLTFISRDLDNEELRRLITYLRDWNTSPKHFCCAQAMLHAVLASKHPQVSSLKKTDNLT